jgi:hypothetical protein
MERIDIDLTKRKTLDRSLDEEKREELRNIQEAITD